MRKKQHRTSGPELLAILLIRLCFLWLLVLASLIMPKGDLSFYAFMAVAFTITIPYSLWLRSKLQSLQFAPLQFVVDLVVVSGLIYFTGGINSDLTLLYPLVILSAGLVSSPRQAAQITVLGILIYLTMVTLLSQNILVEYMPERVGEGATAGYASILLRILTFALFGATSIYVSKRCNYISHHATDIQDTAQTLIQNLDTAILALDGQGNILLANSYACQILNTPEAELVNRTFTDLCVSNRKPIPDQYGTSAYLARTDFPTLAVSYRTTEVSLPASAIPGSAEKRETRQVTLLVFSDISAALEMEYQLEQIERITAATRIAGDMAHEIRTPLTAISASIQLLKHYEKKTTAADWLPNSPRKKDRMELFEHITGASEQMDSVIQNFIDFADFSPNDLMSIIKLDYIDENKGYIGRLNTKAKGLRNGQNSDRGRRPNNSEFVE